MTIYERIAEIRKAVNLTQTAFGQRIGASRDTIANLEGGRSSISSMQKTSICREFNVSQEWLETGEGEMFTLQLDEDAALINELIALGDGHATKELVKAILKLYLSLPGDKKHIIDTAIETAIEATKKGPE